MVPFVKSHLISILAAVGAVGGALASGQPTGVGVWDVALRACLGAALVFAASQSRRNVIIVFATVVAAFSGLTWALLPAAGGLLVSLVSANARRRPKDLGAVVGLLSGLAALRLPPFWRFGAPSLIVALCVIWLAVASYKVGSASYRRKTRRIASIGLSVLVLLSVLIGVQLLGIRSDAQRGIDAAQRSLDAASSGSVALVTADLELAEASFGSANDKLSAIWLKGTRLIPIAAQHYQALTTATAQGELITRQARLAAEAADLDNLQLRAGSIDLTQLAAAAPQLQETADSIRLASQKVKADRSNWLVPPLTRRINLLVDELDDAAPDTQLAADAARLLPRMLGSEAPTRFLVMFGNPAEARELGGFISSYALIEIDNGSVAKLESGRRLDLLDLARQGMFDHPDGYPARFLETDPGQFPSNLTSSPDPLVVARATADLFPTFQGQPLDGIIYLDPFAVAALLGLTGPMSIEGSETPLTSSNAADFLLYGQYELFDGGGERREEFDKLFDVLDQTFDTLRTIDLPGPQGLGAALGPVARQGRLQVVTFDDETNEFLRDVKLLGVASAPASSDFLQVVHANGASNKLDAYVQRDVSYRVMVNDEQQLTGTIDVTVTSTVPEGTPEYVLGRTNEGLEPGQNRMFLSIYTPHQVTSTTVDNVPVDSVVYSESGYARHIVSLVLDPNSSQTVQLTIAGSVDATAPYELFLAHQPLVNDDSFYFEFTDPDGELVVEPVAVVREDTVFAPIEPTSPS